MMLTSTVLTFPGMTGVGQLIPYTCSELFSIVFQSWQSTSMRCFLLSLLEFVFLHPSIIWRKPAGPKPTTQEPIEFLLAITIEAERALERINTRKDIWDLAKQSSWNITAQCLDPYLFSQRNSITIIDTREAVFVKTVCLV